jgi:hypothetical protein
LFKKAVAFFNTLLDSLIILFTALHVLRCAMLLSNIVDAYGTFDLPIEFRQKYFGSALGKGRQAAKT